MIESEYWRREDDDSCLLTNFTGQVPLDSSSVDTVLAISTTSEFPSDKIYGEFSRILKPGGSVFVCTNSEGENVELQQVCAVSLVCIMGEFLWSCSCLIVWHLPCRPFKGEWRWLVLWSHSLLIWHQSSCLTSAYPVGWALLYISSSFFFQCFIWKTFCSSKYQSASSLFLAFNH